mmetsp:Transcript_8636/g.17962  ORF Transcript_8636/g.17962 Transcript_8636/m.17962 type:complete len:339 (-) Transcript_8636:1091-2107(-)
MDNFALTKTTLLSHSSQIRRERCLPSCHGESELLEVVAIIFGRLPICRQSCSLFLALGWEVEVEARVNVGVDSGQDFIGSHLIRRRFNVVFSVQVALNVGSIQTKRHIDIRIDIDQNLIDGIQLGRGISFWNRRVLVINQFGESICKATVPAMPNIEMAVINGFNTQETTQLNGLCKGQSGSHQSFLVSAHRIIQVRDSFIKVGELLIQLFGFVLECLYLSFERNLLKGEIGRQDLQLGDISFQIFLKNQQTLVVLLQPCYGYIQLYHILLQQLVGGIQDNVLTSNLGIGSGQLSVDLLNFHNFFLEIVYRFFQAKGGFVQVLILLVQKYNGGIEHIV